MAFRNVLIGRPGVIPVHRISTDFRPQARDVTIPTLIIHGDQDASIPFHCGQMFHELITGSIFKPYHGAPHGLIVTHVDQVNKDLHDVISTC